jgi:4-diphosphocytidyl-2-C-methyl-D-erythritol kinase
VAVPEVGVSTPRAFRDWDERRAVGFKQGLAEDSGLKPADPEDCIRGVETPHSLRETRLTSPAEPDTLRRLSHAYESVFRVTLSTKQASGTSGIVRGLGPESKQDGLESKTSEQGSTLNGLAGNTLLALVRTGIENDFETVVFPQYPLLREIKRLLMGTSADGFFSAHPADSSGNAIYAALSGSGSALFGLYRSEADAREAQRRVQASGCKAILTETLPRQEYWRTMFAE